MQHPIKLIGREEEIEKINRLLQSNQPEFLAIYGRRRVGKTFLIRQYLKQHIVFDFSGTKDGVLQKQLANFYEEYIKRSKTKKKQPLPSSWQEAFQYLLYYLNSLPKRKSKCVIFIDEMPWLDTPKSGFISALEFFWNQHLANMNHIVLIACGSASSWIRKKLIHARGGLYNRVTQRINLKPFNLHETELFINSMGIKLPQYQIVELYMTMGGIPFYLKEITKGKSATQQIDHICFSPHGLLNEEYTQLYYALFKNAEHHIAIIEALAAQPQGLTRSDISIATGISEGSLSRTIEELIECDFISTYQPFANKKKATIYKLTDLYSLFYLKFIKPNKGATKKTWEQLSAHPKYKAWSGYAFENICVMHTDQIKAALGISGVYSKTNSWKFTGNDALPGAQIDMILDRADQSINLCEAKFTKENFILTKNYAAQLRLKKAIFDKATQTKKVTFTTLITTYPTLKNKYYHEVIDNEVTINKLFEVVL
jgi:uncharacterized protein